MLVPDITNILVPDITDGPVKVKKKINVKHIRILLCNVRYTRSLLDILYFFGDLI